MVAELVEVTLSESPDLICSRLNYNIFRVAFLLIKYHYSVLLFQPAFWNVIISLRWLSFWSQVKTVEFAILPLLVCAVAIAGYQPVAAKGMTINEQFAFAHAVHVDAEICV